MAPKTETKTEAKAPTAEIMKADTDNMTTADIARQLAQWTGGDGAGWEVVIAGSVPYWNPSEAGGEVLFGKLERRQEIVANVKGEAMKAALYTIKLAAPCVANVVTPDGEHTTVGEGETVCIIERQILTDLVKHIGSDIAIFCDGKGKSKMGRDLWRYRVAARAPGAGKPAAAATT